MDSIQSYRITKERGFFLEDHLTELPGKYSAWIDVLKRLPILLEQKLLREKIHELPLLDGSELQTHQELRLGHLALAYLTNAYIWQNGADDAPATLTEVLAVPLYHLSSRMGIKPIISYIDLVLSNTRFLKPLDDVENPMEDMSLEFRFSNDKTEDAFLLISGLCEFKFRHSIQHILEAVRISNEKDQSFLLSQHLTKIRLIVEEVQNVMSLFHQFMDSQALFKRILPLLGGWEPKSRTYPNGLIFEGVSDEPLICYTPNASQTPVYQSIDALLGIDYHPAQRQTLNRTKEYMLKEHQQFINDIGKHSRVKEMVNKGECYELTEAYNDLLSALEAFRTYHLSIVTKYVVIPARAIAKKDKATEATEGENPLKEVVMHLKTMRDCTKDARLSENYEGEKKTSGEPFE